MILRILEAHGMEGLPIIDQAVLIDQAAQVEFFNEDIAFDTNTPANLGRKIEVQLVLDVGAIVEFTLDGTNFSAINNAVAFEGLYSFSLLVENTDLFNLRTKLGAADVSGLVKVTGA